MPDHTTASGSSYLLFACCPACFLHVCSFARFLAVYLELPHCRKKNVLDNLNYGFINKLVAGDKPQGEEGIDKNAPLRLATW